MTAKTAAASAACTGTDGFTRHFERRPEFLFYNQPLIEVVDASTVRERAVDDLKVFRIADVFAGGDEIFFGFGKPNAYLVVPDGKDGYQKFAGKSLKRAPSVVEETRGFVQSGILIRFRNLPPEAAERLREAMKVYHGQKFWTCVNACLHVMQEAGFRSADKELTHRFFPYAFMKSLYRSGITFDGKPVEFQVIRTTPFSVEDYTRQIVKAELATFNRHASRKLHALAKKSKFFAGVEWLVKAPGRLIERCFGKKCASQTAKVVARPLPPDEQYLSDILIRLTRASMVGTLLRQIWGPHALFEARQERVCAGDYLSETLRAFPQPNPSLATRAKKWVLFSRPVIKLIRGVLAPDYVDIGARSERDIYDMLRTDSEQAPNKYNLVLTRSSIIISRINVRAKLVDWILSKHVLMSGYAPDVVFAGEVWKDADGVIHVSRNSGTYRPTAEQLDAAITFLRAVFPHLRFVKD